MWWINKCSQTKPGSYFENNFILPPRAAIFLVWWLIYMESLILKKAQLKLQTPNFTNNSRNQIFKTIKRLIWKNWITNNSYQTNGFQKILQTKPNFHMTENKKKTPAESAAKLRIKHHNYLETNKFLVLELWNTPLHFSKAILKWESQRYLVTTKLRKYRGYLVILSSI